MPEKKRFTIGKFLGKSELRYRRGRSMVATTNPLITTALDPVDFKHYVVQFVVGNDVVSYRRGLRSLATANAMARRLATRNGWRTSLLH